MKTVRRTILYADDDPDDLALFHQAVAAIGSDYTIIEATNGLQAIKLLEQMDQQGEHPCLIVLDINMPGMDGKRTLVAIQNNPALITIPVVLYSTSSSHLDKAFCKSKNVELVTKPFSFETIREVTQNLLHYCKL